MSNYIRIKEHLPQFGIESRAPTVIYRYIKEEIYAEKMMKGYLYISTFQNCRDYEEAERGDKYENYLRYSSGTVSGKPNDPAVKHIAENLGISFGDSSEGDIHISHCVHNIRYKDALVLCTSTDYTSAMMDKFGKHCIAITNVPLFYKLVSEFLIENYSVYRGIAGSTIYNDRWYSGLEKPPKSHIELMKPKIYAWQKEFRLVWHPFQRKNLSAIEIYSEELKQVFQRVS